MMDLILKPLLSVFVIISSLKFLIDIITFIKSKSINFNIRFKQKTNEELQKYKVFINNLKLNFKEKFKLKFKLYIINYYLHNKESTHSNEKFNLNDNQVITINFTKTDILSDLFLKKTLKKFRKTTLIFHIDLDCFNNLYVNANAINKILNYYINYRVKTIFLISGALDDFNVTLNKESSIDIKQVIKSKLSDLLDSSLVTLQAYELLDLYKKTKDLYDFLNEINVTNKTQINFFKNHKQNNFILNNKKDKSKYVKNIYAFSGFILTIFTIIYGNLSETNRESINKVKYHQLPQDVWQHQNNDFNRFLESYYKKKISVKNNKNKNKNAKQNYVSNLKFDLEKTGKYTLEKKQPKSMFEKILQKEKSSVGIVLEHESYAESNYKLEPPFLVLSNNFNK